MSLPILLTKLRKDLEGVFTSLEIAKWWFLKIIWWFHNIMHRSLKFLEMMINKMTMHTTFYFIWKPICWKREILSLFLKYTQTTFWSQSKIRKSISRIEILPSYYLITKPICHCYICSFCDKWLLHFQGIC